MTTYNNNEFYTPLWLKFEGTEGQITTVDSGDFNHTIIRVGDCSITEINPLAGDSSCYFHPTVGNPAGWTIPYNSCFNFGYGDFEISFRIKGISSDYDESGNSFYFTPISCGTSLHEGGKGFALAMIALPCPEGYGDGYYYWNIQFIGFNGEEAPNQYDFICYWMAYVLPYNPTNNNKISISRINGSIVLKINDDVIPERNDALGISVIGFPSSLPFPLYTGDIYIAKDIAAVEWNTEFLMDEVLITNVNADREIATFTDSTSYVHTQSIPQPDDMTISDDCLYIMQRDGVWYLDETLDEEISHTDSSISQNTLSADNSDSIDLTESHTITWPMSSSDTIDFAESDLIISWLHDIAEGLSLTDGNLLTFCLSISDLLFIYDTITHGWNVTATESLELTDSLSEVLGLMISDWITLVDTQANNWNGRDIINDSVYLYDLADKHFTISDTISESVALTDTSTYALTVAVLEYLGFSSLASAMRSTAATVSESLALTETQSYAWAELIQEALSVVDTYTVIQTFVDVIQESLVIADAASLINRLGLSLNESLVFTETVTSRGTLYNAVYDTLKMSVTVELGGEVYECYVLNTPKFMPSMYSGFNFNSYCVFENRAFGANDMGIYELTGTTDAGSTIHTGAILSQTDFGARNEKRFRRAYLGISGTSPVMIFETEEGARQVYNINSEGKTVVSHELKSRKWKLSIADFDELDTMKLIPVILSK